MSKEKEINYITEQGHKALVDELNQLILEERPKITEIIKWAAGNGDRSENADYLYGRKRLREIDRRSNFLRKRIELAKVVNPEQISSEFIKFGATVILEDEQGNTKKVKIVGVDEINTSKGHLSWKSPLGRALLNKQIDDEIEFNSPNGMQTYQILDFSYT